MNRPSVRAAAVLAAVTGSGLPSPAHASEVAPPSVISCPEPPYPAGIDAGPQQVLTHLLIDESGRVREVLRAEGLAPFAAPVTEAALDCRFEPARVDGVPVAVEVPLTWNFDPPPVQLLGQVRQRGTAAPLTDATLHIGDRSTTLDEDGRFTFRGLVDGTHRITMFHPTWRLPPIEVEITPGQAVELELWAYREHDTADELVATYDPNRPGPSQRVLDRDSIRAVPGSLGDPVRALQTQPGFGRSPFDAGWLLVRGGDFDDTGLYMEGVRIPLLYHMGGFTSVLHPEMTEAVRYWTGAQPARLQGTSGAVDVIPAQVGARPRVVAGVNLAWAHAFVETPTRSGGIALAARRSYLDGVMALVVGAEAAQIAPRFSDVQGRLQVGDASMTVLTLSDQFDAPSLDGGTLTVSQTGAQAQGRIPLDVGDGEVVISPWVARHGRALTGDVSEEQSLVELFPGLRVAWESNPRAELRFEGGVETEYRNWTLALGSRAFQLPGARADPWLQASTGREVVIDGGIRIDTLWVRDQLPRAAPSPRTSVQWEVSDRLTLHTEVGRFHAIPLVTLLAGLPEGAYLPLERSDLVSAGMQTTQQVWRFDANVYQRNLAHLAALEDDGSVGQLVGRARGLETQLAWQPERATVTLLYQYARTERREDRDSDPVPAITDQPHRLQLLGVTHLPRSLTLSSRFRYGSGFPRALDEETGLMEPQTAFDLLTQSYAPAAASVDAPRLRPFYSLDVKISRQVQLKHWRLDLWLDVQNVFNRRVAEPLITGFGESRPSYGVGLPILPIFGVEGVWWPSPRSDEASPRSRPASGD